MKKFCAWLKKEDGYAIAEFAITIPILIFVTSFCVWAIETAITKFQMENIANQVVRLIARGESLPENFLENVNSGMKVNVSEAENKIHVQVDLIQKLPILDRQINLQSRAEGILEVYEFQE